MTSQWVAQLGPDVTDAVDLDAYFKRINYPGGRDVTVATLHALCAAHVRSIPFENIDVLLTQTVSLDPRAVDAKILDAGRGGYCFEQNTLMLRVLCKLGYAVRPISSRVRIGRASDSRVCPRTHVLLVVTIEQVQWVVDVGVGGLSLTMALRLDVEGEQPTYHEPRRITREKTEAGMLYIHQAFVRRAWVDVSDFTLEAMPCIDRETANWFTATHPHSHMRNRLVVARALEGAGRLTLVDRCLTETVPTSKTITDKDIEGAKEDTLQITRRCIETPEELLEVLETHFGIVLPAGTVFDCLQWDADAASPKRRKK